MYPFYCYASITQVPISRPSIQWKETNKRVSRGAPSRYAAGRYPQTYGTIRQSDLLHLQHNNW